MRPFPLKISNFKLKITRKLLPLFTSLTLLLPSFFLLAQPTSAQSPVTAIVAGDANIFNAGPGGNSTVDCDTTVLSTGNCSGNFFTGDELGTADLGEPWDDRFMRIGPIDSCAVVPWTFDGLDNFAFVDFIIKDVTDLTAWQVLLKFDNTKLAFQGTFDLNGDAADGFLPFRDKRRSGFLTQTQFVNLINMPVVDPAGSTGHNSVSTSGPSNFTSGNTTWVVMGSSYTPKFTPKDSAESADTPSAEAPEGGLLVRTLWQLPPGSDGQLVTIDVSTSQADPSFPEVSKIVTLVSGADEIGNLPESQLGDVQLASDGPASSSPTCQAPPSPSPSPIPTPSPSPSPTDSDGDGFSDLEETASGSNPTNALSTPEICDSRDNDLDGQIDEKWDRDGDGIPDCQEFDTDNDNISKTVDNCPYAADASEKDNDNDGKGDVCEVRLSIDPPATTDNQGVLTISANIRIANYHEYGGLRGYEWKIAYDPRILQFLSLVNGSFISTNSFTPSCQSPVKTTVSSTQQTLFFKCNAFGEGWGGTGGGILSTVTLQITGLGSTAIAFNDENLFNLNENNQTHVVGDFGEPLSKVSGLVAVCNDLQPGDIDVDLDGVPDSCDLELDNDNLAPSQETQFGTNNAIPDTDADGLTDGKEVVAGLSPTNADTDGDGLTDGSVSSEDLDNDGLVSHGETSPNIPDSDFDGLPDGLERSLTSPEAVDTDLSRGNFVPDACPTTSTDPTLGDTDNDGQLDGFEDLNHNGCLDPGEGDPNPPKDADADGFLDPVDPCPLDAEDFDGYKDADGCPELDAKDLRTAVLGLANINPGIRTSLLAKIDSIQKAQDQGDLNSYNNALNAFKNEVQALSGKQLSTADVQALINLANSLTLP